jgi:hypothetical protein
MALTPFFIHAAPLVGILLDEKPPAQVFVHVTFRVLILGALLGLTYLGRRVLKRLSARAGGDAQEDTD